MTSRTSRLALALLLLTGWSTGFAQGLFTPPFPPREEATVEEARREACRALEALRVRTRAALALREALPAHFRAALLAVVDDLARVTGRERLAVVYAHTEHRREELAVEAMLAGFLRRLESTAPGEAVTAYPLLRIEGIQAFLREALAVPGDGTTLALRLELLLFIERSGAGIWLGSPISSSPVLSKRAGELVAGKLDGSRAGWAPPEVGHELTEAIRWTEPVLKPFEKRPPETLGQALELIEGQPPRGNPRVPPSLLHLAGEGREVVQAPGPGFLSGTPVGPRPFRPRRLGIPFLGPPAMLLLVALLLVGGLAALAYRQNLRLGREVAELRSDPRYSDAPGSSGGSGPPSELPAGGEDLPSWLRASLDPDILRRYSGLRTLGSGGMGTVLAGHDERLGRDVAIKVPPPHLVERPSFRLRFLREARALARLDHPHVARIYDVHDPEGEAVPGIVMELLTGQDLSQWLDAQGPVTLERAVRWIGQAATALQHAHDAGILHRDVKPANIFLDPAKDEVKLVDFGLAAVDDDEILTTTGAVMGSRPFMSPEQLRGEPMDATTDQYSLAASFYFLVTGELPFDPGPAIRIDVPRLEHAHPDASDRLGGVVARALALHPRDRYTAITTFAAELAAAL